jgi:DNA-binding NarL/FixJ family response regulator
MLYHYELQVAHPDLGTGEAERIMEDFIMPQMNGLETARRLTQRHPDVLILMVTTDPSRQLEIEARRAGIKGVCAKNEIQCLLKAVEVVINGETRTG